ncbi:MAG: TRAP transporter substrate-binding protein DctP [Cyanobacteria bacterium P01_F01_bin.86]
MKRRHLARQLTLGAAGAGLFSACSSQKVFTNDSPGDSGPTIEWRMATSWLETLEIRFAAIQQICNRVSELTRGNFTIIAFPAGGIAPPQEILETVQSGSVECGHTSAHYSVSQNRAFTFASGLPFGLNPQQHLAWLYAGGGLELLRSLYADYNIINFPAGTTGSQMGGWFRRKINSLDEMKGVKMRMPGIAAEILQRVGVQTEKLPPGEILLALERDIIDAAEWVGPYEDEILGLNQYAPYYYYPGWQDFGSTQELIVNQEAYMELPEDYRKALELAAFESRASMLAQYDAANGAALQRLVSSGTELVPFSEEILQELQNIANDLYNEYASQDATFQRIYDNWNTFRQNIYRWSNLSESSFVNLTANR